MAATITVTTTAANRAPMIAPATMSPVLAAGGKFLLLKIITNRHIVGLPVMVCLTQVTSSKQV